VPSTKAATTELQCSEPISNSSALDALDKTVKVVFVERDFKAQLLVTMHVLVVSGGSEQLHAVSSVNGQPLYDLCTCNNLGL